MAKKQLDELDQFVKAGPEKALAMVLWKIRRHYPELAVPITADDIKAFYASMEFTKQLPKVVVFRRPAVKGSPSIPAEGKRRAIPPTPAQPAGKTAVVMLVEEGTEMKDPDTRSILSPGNTIRPVESDEKDHDRAKKLRELKSIKEKAKQLAADISRDASAGMYSDSRIHEAAQALVLLSE